MDRGEKILSREEKIISSSQNEQLILRITKSLREGATYQMTSEIKKKRIKKDMLPQVIERMKWKKFGKVANQERGVLEPGIVEVNTDEIHIIDRKRDIEKDLGDKLRDKINDKKSKLLKEIKEKKEKNQIIPAKLKNPFDGKLPKDYNLGNRLTPGKLKNRFGPFDIKGKLKNNGASRKMGKPKLFDKNGKNIDNNVIKTSPKSPSIELFDKNKKKLEGKYNKILGEKPKKI